MPKIFKRYKDKHATRKEKIIAEGAAEILMRRQRQEEAAAAQRREKERLHAAFYLATRIRRGLDTALPKDGFKVMSVNSQGDTHVIKTNIPLEPNKACSGGQDKTLTITVNTVNKVGHATVTVDLPNSFQTVATFDGPTAYKEVVECVRGNAKRKRSVAPA